MTIKIGGNAGKRRVRSPFLFFGKSGDKGFRGFVFGCEAALLEVSRPVAVAAAFGRTDF